MRQRVGYEMLTSLRAIGSWGKAALGSFGTGLIEELSLSYHFLRRWGMLILLGLLLGGLAGFGYVEDYRQSEFEISAKLHNEKGLDLRVISARRDTVDLAIKSILADRTKLDTAIGAWVEISKMQVIKHRTEGWWKTVILGGVLGIIPVAFVIFLWNEAQSALREQQVTGQEARSPDSP